MWLDAAGEPIGIGTDGPGGGPFFATELELMIEAGFEPWRVLELATAGGARVMRYRILPGPDTSFAGTLHARPHASLVRRLRSPHPCGARAGDRPGSPMPRLMDQAPSGLGEKGAGQGAVYPHQY
jgi:hypothetical protein